MSRKMTPDDLLSLSLPGEPQLSPDGRRLAYVVARIDPEKNTYRRRIYVMDAVPGAHPVPFTAGSKSDTHPRWSPDGSKLAFVSDRSGQDQIWLMDAHGGEASQLTSFKAGISGEPIWSPDGRQIAFTAKVGAEGPGDEAAKDDEQDLFKKYTQGVRRINKIWYKLDGAGLLDPEKHTQVFIVDVSEERPAPQQVTRGAWNHRTPVWSPDGGSLLFVANREPEGDYTPFREDLWLQDLADRAADPQRLTPGTFSVSTPAFSPDGRQIAFRGYEEARYQGYSSERLWLMNRDGGGLTRLDRNWDRTFDSAVIYDMPAPGGMQLAWTSDGTALVTLASDSGRQQVVAIDAETGNVTALTGGDHCITSWSLDQSGLKLVVSLTRPDLPGDLFLVESADLTRLTHVNEALLAELELAPVEAFRFATAEGSNAFVAASGLTDLTEADGWVMKPAGFDPDRRYPAILEVHGGPMGMYGWTFFMEFQCLAAAGYAVIYTNPRGSQGYAERFCASIQADWGNLDYLDVMAGLDAALAQFPWIDGARLGIAGGSYGGFMTNWAVGHTDRFKAAVTMRSVVNEASSVGTSDFGFADMMTYPTTPWTDMTFYRRVSPLTFVEQIHTPLLIEHQEEDRRCPIEQAEQLYTALKMLRREVEFVRYPESSHGMSRTGKPWLRVHRLRSIVDWFDRYISHP